MLLNFVLLFLIVVVSELYIEYPTWEENSCDFK